MKHAVTALLLAALTQPLLAQGAPPQVAADQPYTMEYYYKVHWGHQQEFLQLRFALFGPGVKPPYTPYLPSQAWVMKPNQDTELWDFTELQVNIPGIDARQFEKVEIPGWTTKKATPPGGPPPANPPGPPPVPGVPAPPKM